MTIDPSAPQGASASARSIGLPTFPLYAMAGEKDDITAHQPVFAATKLMGTPKKLIEERVVPGGHVGLFMGARNLKEVWPEIAAWIAAQANGKSRHA